MGGEVSCRLWACAREVGVLKLRVVFWSMAYDRERLPLASLLCPFLGDESGWIFERRRSFDSAAKLAIYSMVCCSYTRHLVASNVNTVGTYPISIGRCPLKERITEPSRYKYEYSKRKTTMP